MRLVSYSHGGSASFGVLSEDGRGVIDLGRRMAGATDLDDVIQQERLAEVAEHLGDEPDHALEDVTVERLLGRPGRIYCIGVNYGGRGAEYRDGDGAQGYPSVFVRFVDSLTGHGHPLVRPPESEQLDYEGEIVVVIGKGGRRIPRSEALSHIAGLTLGNEGTIRDWVRHGKFNVTQGKNWSSSGAIGPWLVTPDEVGDVGHLELTTTVNGERRQHDTTATMQFPIAFQIEYLSTFAPLSPGDVIFTGTPTGAGARLDPPVWLAPGDVVEVTVPGIGTLTNTVTDEVVDRL